MLFSVTEKFSLWASTLIVNILGIKIKTTSGNLLYTLLHPFRRSADFGKNNKVIVADENGNLKNVPLSKVKNIKIYFYGDNNIITIHKPCKLVRSDVVFSGSNSTVEIGKNCEGKLQILNYYNNCHLKIGENAYICYAQVVLYGNSLEVGNNCLFSNNIKILSDGHSVLDKNSGEVLNKAMYPIKIGNHVWVGERVTMTKNAQIPDDCIIGIQSVVTKKFDEPNCVIAGSPAKIVKRNINWHSKAPI